MESTENSSADNRKYHLTQFMLIYTHSSDTYNEGLHFVDKSVDCEQYRDVLKYMFGVVDQGPALPAHDGIHRINFDWLTIKLLVNNVRKCAANRK